MSSTATQKLSQLTITDRVKFYFILFSIAVLGVILPSDFAHANDTFPGQTLTGNSGSFVDNNIGYTSEPGEPLSLGGGSLNTQWYTWVAPVNGFVSFGTCNPAGSTLTNFDTTIGVYTGNAVNALTQIIFNDDTTGCNSTVNANYASTVGFNAVAGTSYRIQVDGYGNATGQFNFFYGYSGFTAAVTTAGATEGGATGAFTVVLNAVPSATATIAIGTSPQCTYSPSTLTFTSANWNTAQTVTVTAIDDAVVEGTHFCAPSSITPSGGGVAASSATPPSITITDNDTATVSIANTTNGAEAGPVSGVMTVTMSKVSAVNTTISYTVTGTATSGTDYTALAGSITILAGSSTGTISIPVIDDAIVETAETVIVTLNSVTSGVSTSIGAPSSATNTIADNDSAKVNIANTTNGSETGPTAGVMTLTQTAVSATNTVVAYTVSGTATSGSDYTALSGTVTIAAGATTATINIPVINDAAVEGNETVIITLSSITSGLATLGTTLSATNTIFDNDSPLVTIANTTNGNETGPVNGVMTVSLSAVSAGNAVIAYSVSGTATSGSDFTALSGTLTIPAGSTTGTISIPIIDDAIVEGSETIIVTLTSVTSGTVTLGATLVATNTVADNDAATVTIANTTNGTETGPANGLMTLTQTKASATNTVLNYTIGGTATAGSDYTALSGTVTILAGATTATISIPTLDDAIVEGPESVLVTLTSVTSGLATLGASLVATNTIADNDTATLSIANTTNGAEAGGPTNGVMTLTQTALSSTNTGITYTVGGTATSGTDYTALSGTVTILAGATTATITIPVLDDLVVEPSETVTVTLTGPTSGLITLSATVLATNTIADNDVASFSIAKAVNLGNITSPSTLNYTITIASTGNVPLTAPVLTDALSNGAALTLTSGPTLTSGDAAPLGVLNAGETWIYTATYAVSQANINNGAAITNSATFDTAETAPATSNTVTTTITQNPHLTIAKTASTNGPVPAGAVITYTYTVINDGNMTMTNEVVNDTHNGSGILVGPGNDALVSDVAPTGDTTDAAVNGIWDTIGPGDTIKFTATYTVTQNDVDYLQ